MIYCYNGKSRFPPFVGANVQSVDARGWEMGGWGGIGGEPK